MNSLETRYRRAFIHLENGDTSFVTSVLNSIPDDFSLTIEQSNIHQKYEDLLDVLRDLTLNVGSVMALDSTQIADLLNIYDNETLPGIYARHILVTAGYLTYQEPYLFPDNLKKMEIRPETQTPTNNEAVILKVFPNPASYYSIVEFDVSTKAMSNTENSQVFIAVSDVRGITLKTLETSQILDQVVLDVRNLKPGIYFINLVLNAKRISTVKLFVDR